MAKVLTEIAAPVHGILPLLREAVVRFWIAADDFQEAAPARKTDPLAQLESTAASMSEAARAILHARNHAARSAQRPATASPPSCRAWSAESHRL